MLCTIGLLCRGVIEVAIARCGPVTADDDPDIETLISRVERPIAVFVSPWRNGDQLGAGVQSLVDGLDYSSYHMFIGVCPNDTLSLREAERLAGRYNHVHRVVSSGVGPLVFSEAMGALLDGVAEYEEETGIRFTGYVEFDLDDVVHPLVLRVFNYWSAQYDIVELPRYGKRGRFQDLVAGCVTDDAADVHCGDNRLHARVSDTLELARVLRFATRAVYDRLVQEPWYERQCPVSFGDLTDWLYSLGLRRKFCRMRLDAPARLRKRPGEIQRRETGHQLASVRLAHLSFWQVVTARAERIAEAAVAPLFHPATDTRAAHFLSAWRKVWVPLLWRIFSIGLMAAIVLAVLPATRNPELSALSGLLVDWHVLVGLLVFAALLTGIYFGLRVARIASLHGLDRLLMAPVGSLLSVLIKIIASWQALFVRIERDRGLALDLTGPYQPVPVTRTDPLRLGEVLVEQGLVARRDIAETLSMQANTRAPLGRLLLRRGLVSESDLLQAVGTQLNYPVFEFSPYRVPLAVVRLLPFSIIRRYRVLPVSVRVDGEILVATYRQPSPKVRTALERACDAPISLCLARRSEVRDGIVAYGRIRGLLDEQALDDDSRTLGDMLEYFDRQLPDTSVSLQG